MKKLTNQAKINLEHEPTLQWVELDWSWIDQAELSWADLKHQPS